MSGSAVRVLVALLLSVLGAGDPVARVTQMNREALAAVDKREFEKAREILKRALELCESAGLDEHPIAARTHVHMGVVILEGFKNRELGLKQFTRALAIDPEIAVTPSLATPELVAAFEEARSRAAGIDGAPPESAAPAAPRPEPAPERDGGDLMASGAPPEEEPPRWFASPLVGGGVGTVSGHGELNADTPVPGSVSAALLGQLSPEIGVWATPHLMLSGQARVQVVTGPTEIDADGRVYSPERWALALFGKASWFFGDGAVRPFVSGALGGGQIRHVVTFDALRDCGPARNQTSVDTVAAGPALAQMGGGLMVTIAGELAFLAGANLQLAAPQFTANLDLNAGLAFAF
jgi:hypothetical protein